MRKNFSQHVLSVFANHKTSYEQMSRLLTDLALHREIFDENTGKVVPNAQAEAMVHKFSLEILGIDKDSDRKEIRRALRDHGRELMDIIEDSVSEAIEVGYGSEPWFEMLVETKSLKYGDRQDWKVDREAILAVAKVGESHHDHILQRIGVGAPITIPTARYAVKIGEDINKYILGQSSWAKMVDAIAKAYIRKIQELVSAEVVNLNSVLPAAVVGNGALDGTTKENFDEIISRVQGQNDGAEVVVMGTKIALKKITAIADVNWGAKDQRDAMMNTGTIGIYEGVRLVEIPQRFSDKTLSDESKLISDKKLLILPVVSDNKPIKFLDEGDTEITQVTDKGEENGRWDDIMSYEVQRRFGVGVVLGRILGEWTLP